MLKWNFLTLVIVNAAVQSFEEQFCRLLEKDVGDAVDTLCAALTR